MTRLILRRVILFAAVLLAVNAASYMLMNFLRLRGPMAYGYIPDTRVPFLDVVASYPSYLWTVVHGDLGTIAEDASGVHYALRGTPVWDYILFGLPRSLVLLGIAVLVSIGVGIVIGFLSVNYKKRRTSSLALIFSLGGFSMPGFYLGILILYLMIRLAMAGIQTDFLLPVSGYGLNEHLILPVLALSARPAAEISRLTAELLVEELPKNYVRTARAKGLPWRLVILRHAFRNVVAAVITAMSNSWSYLIGALVIIERVFLWGGLGQALVGSVTFSHFAGSSFDPQLVAGLATALAFIFLIADQVTEWMAHALDPRLRRVHERIA